jgi:hypothetical protein
MDLETRAYLADFRRRKAGTPTAVEAAIAAAQAVVDAFNAQTPVGTCVRYWTGVREGAGVESATRSKAQRLGGSTGTQPVVWVNGQSGCIALTHVEVI